MSAGVGIVEVGPRDGLQNEPGVVPAAERVRFIEALADAGHARIEAGAFVAPAAVPSMAGSDEVFRALARRPGVTYLALVPNEKGLERALAGGAGAVAVFTAASETFNRRNINAGIEESFARLAPVVDGARRAGLPVRGYVSTVVHCPYEGRIAPSAVVPLVRRLLDLGAGEVSLGETIGRATPNEVRGLLRALRSEGLLDRCAGHFHDTCGTGVANVLAAFEEGVRVFDASAGGLGGCPYAPGAAGNVATEDLLHLFAGLGVPTGIDFARQVAATAIIEAALGRPLSGRAYRAGRKAPPG